MNRRKSFLSRVSRFFEMLYEWAFFSIVFAVFTLIVYSAIADALGLAIGITPKAFIGWGMGGILISLILRDSQW